MVPGVELGSSAWGGGRAADAGGGALRRAELSSSTIGSAVASNPVAPVIQSGLGNGGGIALLEDHSVLSRDLPLEEISPPLQDDHYFLVMRVSFNLPARSGCGELPFQFADKLFEPFLSDLVIRRVEKPPRHRRPVPKFPALAL
jgi:hypothetical protein